MNIFDKKHIFLVGIKGVAMANMALILKEKGISVSGADVAEEFHTDAILKKHAIPTHVGFSETLLTADIDLVVYSAAHGGIQNPIVIAAQQKGITVMSQAEFLAALFNGFSRSIAVAGCHGKTTTTAVLAYALTKLGAQPSYLVGAAGFSGMPAAQYHQGDIFVIEADEYGVNPPLDKTPKFHYLRPHLAIVTNIDFDHPDIYKDLPETQQAFAYFLKTMVETHADALAFVCADNEPLMNIMKEFSPEAYRTYGFAEGADYRITQVTPSERGVTFTLQTPNGEVTATTKLWGNQNITNLAGVVGLLLTVGFSQQNIVKSIAEFAGVTRRFEEVYHDEKKDIYIIDDYAHHPTEIEAVIRAARMRFPGRKIIVLFQPHTVSRTKSLAHEFIRALSHADQAYIVPIFESAREPELAGTYTAEDLVQLAQSQPSTQIELYSSPVVAPTDVIVTMGAGDVYKLKNDIIKAL